MLASEFLSDIRAVVDDELALGFDDDYLLAQGYRKIQRMFRKMTETQEAYHFIEHDVESDALTDVDAYTKELILPPWVSKIRDVRPRTGTGATTSLGDRIEHLSGDMAFRTAWRSWGDNRIRLHHWEGSTGLRLVVSKTPAPPIIFTAADVPAAINQVVLPASPTKGRYASQADWYKNERFECTATAAVDPTTHAVTGVRGYCTASTPNQTVSSALRTVLTFSTNWPDAIAVGDVFESVIPLPDELTRLPVLETAMICFQHHGNSEAQVALLDELRQERKDFAAYIQQRQVQGPDFYLCEDDWRGYDDPNRDTSYSY